MRYVVAHIARWLAWHAEGAAIGDSERPHARITIVSTAAASAGEEPRRG